MGDAPQALGLGPGRLFVDLIPRTSWFHNARSLLPTEVWRRLSRARALERKQVCEVCAEHAPPLHLHERWTYDEAAGVQLLAGLISLCAGCHGAVHFGLSEVRGQGDEAFERLVRVNGWTDEQGEDHIEEAFVTWERRSLRPWQVDVSSIEAELRRFGIPGKAPSPTAAL